jgi:hypothetical protein
MVDDPITEVSRPHLADFRVSDDKTDRLAGIISFVFQFFLQLKNIFFKINLELCGTRAFSLRFPALAVGFEKILK